MVNRLITISLKVNVPAFCRIFLGHRGRRDEKGNTEPGLLELAPWKRLDPDWRQRLNQSNFNALQALA
jgi:hypothetical protein